ncbi:mannosyl-oligosaccharide alpha-1,2-mannosidase IA isoform X2 [Rhagoletis pomonella]|uniref:mannosyl-oligosaccharide alpha-1,2-mannosidase IA isoform X2 n=1 Tax=Rhagoletis pomonella TaxID=28610 RepID=UPI00178240C0|nr:mannosyl-oligosaccharide alpha-1,2-mannosidase IA isoform X2 [Rhagoletis pomonella]XP_036318436.1 mannosyl-oligosaccharide alpha-1,2-mannosidase IA isoform X2 [Rhagoletis pomonella]
MCSRKCFRVHTLVILGIIITIVLVCIVGITLTNSINISNIIKLREKVASDSAAATGANAVQTRAALVEQQYSTLQQHHLSRSDLNYIAATHPKNLQRFASGSGSGNSGNGRGFGDDPANNAAQNKIVIEIALRNFSTAQVANASFAGNASVTTSSSSVNSLLDRLIEPITSAIVDGNIDSISVPATATRRQLNESLSQLVNAQETRPLVVATESTTTDNAATVTAASTVASSAWQYTTTSPTAFTPLQAIERLAIADHNPGQIDFAKREHVKQMMLHAWENYKLYAWGKNELRPLSQRPHSGSIFGAYDLGATIVDGLDTLYLMGLEKEYQEGRDWIERKFSLDNISADLSVFETNIRFVGGMLTLYAFTGDNLYKEKAQHIADKLLPAFQTPTGIPYALVNTRTGVSRNYGWASGGSSILSEVGTLHCEFVYLSDITGNPLYRERVQTIRQVLKEIEKPKGLYPNFINPKTGKWGQMHMSLGALGDSFFEYLLKAWLQSGQVDEEAREMFDDAMVSINEHMIRTSSGGLTYVSDLKFDRLEHKMDHLACFAGGLFALAANTRQNQYANKFMEIGKGLTNTCHESYARTATKLGPEAFRFSDAAEARALKSQEKYYILRPETIESYFVLWRLTHDQKYRDWGWEAVQALEAHCRTPHGYCGIKNVYQEMPQKDDVQQSFFLAETLKYLYLLFSDDSLLPLDEWIFNTEAHPLPVRSANVFYRAAPPAQTQADENR